MNKKTLFFISALLVFLAFFVIIFMNNGGNKIPGAPMNSASNPNEAEFNMEAKKPDPNSMLSKEAAETTDDKSKDSSVKEFVIEAGSFYYKPNMVKVAKGDKVKITINAVSMMHDLNIEGYKVATEVAQSGKSASVEFIADKVGTFEMFCSVGQHRANGQVGKFIVE